MQTALHMSRHVRTPNRCGSPSRPRTRTSRLDDAPTKTTASIQVRESRLLAGDRSGFRSSSQRSRSSGTIKFSYWSPRRDAVRERSLNPSAPRDRGTWYVVGRTSITTIGRSGSRGSAATSGSRPPRARLPHASRLRCRRLPGPRGGSRGRSPDRADRGERGTRPGGSTARSARPGRSPTGSSRPSSGDRAAGRLGAAPERPGRSRSSPRTSGARVPRGSSACGKRTRPRRPSPRARSRWRS